MKFSQSQNLHGSLNANILKRQNTSVYQSYEYILKYHFYNKSKVQDNLKEMKYIYDNINKITQDKQIPLSKFLENSISMQNGINKQDKNGCKPQIFNYLDNYFSDGSNSLTKYYIANTQLQFDKQLNSIFNNNHSLFQKIYQISDLFLDLFYTKKIINHIIVKDNQSEDENQKEEKEFKLMEEQNEQKLFQSVNINKQYENIVDEIIDQNNWQLKQQNNKNEQNQENDQFENKNEENKQKKEEKVEEKKEEKEENQWDWDKDAQGFKQEDLKEYEIEETNFQSLQKKDKLDLLKQKKKYNLLQKKMKLLFLRETNLLQKLSYKDDLVISEELSKFVKSEEFTKVLNEHFNKKESQKFLFLRFLEEEIVKILPQKIKDQHKKAMKVVGKSNQYNDENDSLSFCSDEYDDMTESDYDEEDSDQDMSDIDDDEEEDEDNSDLGESKGDKQKEDGWDTVSDSQDNDYQLKRKLTETDSDIILSVTSASLSEFDLKQYIESSLENKNEDNSKDEDSENEDDYDDDFSESKSEEPSKKQKKQNQIQKYIQQQLKIPLVQKNIIENLENLVSLVPTFSEQFILQLVKRAHIHNINQNDEIFKNFLDIFLLNPYNAYKFIDIIQFLLVQNIQAKTGLDNPIFEMNIHEYQKTDKVDVKGSIGVYHKIFYNDLPDPQKNAIEHKIFKAKKLFNILEHVLSQNQNLFQTCVFNYPLHNREQFELTFDQETKPKIFEVKFQPLEILKDFKFQQVFKGLGENLSMFNLKSYYMKWLDQDKPKLQNVVIDLNYDDEEEGEQEICELTKKTIEKVDSCMIKFLDLTSFQGDKIQFSKDKYPKIVRPQKELNFEILTESMQQGIIVNKQRIKDTELWNLTKKLCKTVPDYINLTQSYFQNSTKYLRDKLLKSNKDLISFKTKIKVKYQLDDLNHGGSNVSDAYYQFEDFLYKFESLFNEDFRCFRLSLKDLINLHKKVCENEFNILQVELKEKYIQKQQIIKEDKQKEKENKKKEENQEKELTEEEKQKIEEEKLKKQEQQEELEKQKKKMTQQQLKKLKQEEEEQKIKEEKLMEERNIIKNLDLKQWYKEQKKKILEQQKSTVIQAWMNDISCLKALFADIIEFIYNCQSFCWNNSLGSPYTYNHFAYAMKSIVILHEFLYEGEENKKAQKQLEKKEKEDLLPEMPNLSKMRSIGPDPQMLGSMNISNSVGGVNMLMSMKHDIEIVAFPDLYEIMTKKLLNMISFFLGSEDVQRKKRWIKLMENLSEDKKTFKKLDAEMKIAQISSLAKYEAKLRLNKKDDYYSNTIYITLDRDQVWNSTLMQLTKYSYPQITLNSFDIKFNGEQGIDGGGLTREWITLALKEIFNPNNGLFITSSNNVTMRPNPSSYLIPSHLKHFEFAGVLTAKGLLEKLDIEVDLTRSFLKHILQKYLYIQDLEDIDPEEAKNLHWILENDVEGLDVTFSVDIMKFGQYESIDLIPDGQNVLVTNQNKKKYVKTLAHFKMTELIQEQTKAFIKGFYSIIPFKALKLLDVKEFGLLLAGVKTIDVQDMQKYASFDGYNANSQQIKWLFELLTEQDEETKALFLFFVTGSFKVPYGGFKNLNIEISKINSQKKLPVAHTCSKQLDLPCYATKELLEQKILTAIQEGHKGFYIG